MSLSNTQIVTNYYTSLLNNDIDSAAQYIAEDVNFVGPLAEVSGKEMVVEAAKGFMLALQELDIRLVLEDGDNVMIAYHMTMPAPIGRFSAAGMFTVTDGLIRRIELFYDARPFGDIGQQIFQNTAR